MWASSSGAERILPSVAMCSKFGFYQGGIPTPMMEKCLLYKMVQYGTR